MVPCVARVPVTRVLWLIVVDTGVWPASRRVILLRQSYNYLMDMDRYITTSYHNTKRNIKIRVHIFYGIYSTLFPCPCTQIANCWIVRDLIEFLVINWLRVCHVDFSATVNAVIFLRGKKFYPRCHYMIGNEQLHFSALNISIVPMSFITARQSPFDTLIQVKTCLRAYMCAYVIF